MCVRVCVRTLKQAFTTLRNKKEKRSKDDPSTAQQFSKQIGLSLLCVRLRVCVFVSACVFVTYVNEPDSCTQTQMLKRNSTMGLFDKC